MGQVVAREILGEITGRGLPPGSRLPPEAEMLIQYEVGRGTLREALRILEVNGLISLKPGPGGGPVVENASVHDFGRMATLFMHARGITVGELIEARLIIEPVCARLAAERCDEEAAERLRAVIAYEERGEEDAYVAATWDFHTLVADISGNGVIALFNKSLAEVFHARVRQILFPAGNSRRGVIATHNAIARAIIDGEAASAEALMFEHMQAYVKYVQKSHPTIFKEVVDWMA